MGSSTKNPVDDIFSKTYLLSLNIKIYVSSVLLAYNKVCLIACNPKKWIQYTLGDIGCKTCRDKFPLTFITFLRTFCRSNYPCLGVWEAVYSSYRPSKLLFPFALSTSFMQESFMSCSFFFRLQISSEVVGT